MFAFLERIVFDLVPLAHENKPLSDLTKVYCQLLNLNYQETLKLIDNRILKVTENKREFFETLVSNLESSTRELHAHILLQAVNQSFREDNITKVDEIMNQVFSMIPDDLSKNWLKIFHFLWFLKELSTSGAKQLLYLMDNKVITKLIDFFLENDSPMITVAKNKKRSPMGSNYARPPLEQLIYTISYIARMQTYVDLGFQEQVPGQYFYPKYSVFTLNKEPVAN